MKTAEAARNKWKGILLTLGVDERFLSGKHGPCPFCAGRDRYRFDNQHGGGGFICGQCGAGNGFEFLMRLNGWDWATAAAEVDKVLGNVQAEPIKPEMTEDQRRQMLNRLWSSGRPLDGQDMASRYLASRNALPTLPPSCLRFAERCPVPGGTFAPALLARVIDAVGKPVNIHRTFLGPNGKADLPTPRAMMKGEVPAGSAVRLFPVRGQRLGIAEGIETALNAARRFGLPVWSAIDAGKMAKWEPPVTVREVVVFGDNDSAFGGQAAAYTVAHRLTVRKLRVKVSIPQQIGLDWADSDAA